MYSVMRVLENSSKVLSQNKSSKKEELQKISARERGDLGRKEGRAGGAELASLPPSLLPPPPPPPPPPPAAATAAAGAAAAVEESSTRIAAIGSQRGRRRPELGPELFFCFRGARPPPAAIPAPPAAAEPPGAASPLAAAFLPRSGAKEKVTHWENKLF